MLKIQLLQQTLVRLALVFARVLQRVGRAALRRHGGAARLVGRAVHLRLIENAILVLRAVAGQQRLPLRSRVRRAAVHADDDEQQHHGQHCEGRRRVKQRLTHQKSQHHAQRRE